jgi:hypothetical protein
MRIGTCFIACLQLVSSLTVAYALFSGLTATLATVLLWATAVCNAAAMLLMVTAAAAALFTLHQTPRRVGGCWAVACVHDR